MTDSWQVCEQIHEWNGEKTADRYSKASLYRRHGELRKQNAVTTLLAPSCRHMPYTVFSSLFYFAHLLYQKTVMITTISKCTEGTTKSMSRIVSMRRYTLTFRALALISSVDTIRALSLFYYRYIVYIYRIKYEQPLIRENVIGEYCVNLQSAKV